MPELDDAYANGAYIARADEYPARWAQNSALLRESMGENAQSGLPYGPSKRQTYDVFHPVAPSKGTLIFVHGGYWRAFDSGTWSYLAAGALKRGWRVAMPSYDLCPDIRIAGITQEIAQAIQVIGAQYDGPLSLSGHSAGGHLVARMLAPGMLPASLTKRICHVAPISPLSDLEPLCQTSMNADFGMDVEMAKAESPILQPKPEISVSIHVGENERPAFLDQAMWLGDAWQCPMMIEPGKHHFDVIDCLNEPESDMLQRLTP